MNYRVKDNIVTRSIRNETILVPIMDSMEALDSLYTLNETGTLIWEGLKNGLSDDQITQNLVTDYAVTPQTARQDVNHILAELLKLKLIVPSAG